MGVNSVTRKGAVTCKILVEAITPRANRVLPRFSMKLVRLTPLARKRVLPGLLLVGLFCLSGFILLNVLQTSPSSFNGASTPRERRAITKTTIDIHVVANNRPSSLGRLLDSLKAANPPTGSNLYIHVEARATHDELDVINAVDWPYGKKDVFTRVRKAGLVAAILEAWYPTHDSDVALLLEDDLSVSPLVFEWIETFWPLCEESRSCAGLGLHTPRVNELANPKRRIHLPLAHDFKVYGQPLPCSWGSVWKPHFWRQLHEYTEARLDINTNRYFLPVDIGTAFGWKTSWKKYALELLLLTSTHLIYPNFEDQASLVTNHVEAGEHIHAKDLEQRKLMYEVPLLKARNQWPETLADMPQFDIHFRSIPFILGIESIAPLQTGKASTYQASGADCRTHSWQIESIVRTPKASEETATVLLSHFYSKDRFPLLPILIEIYCAAVTVEKVIVIWHNTKYQVRPQWQCSNGKPVIVIHTRTDSLLNRFAPNPAVETKFVITADDDMMPNAEDVDTMVHVARMNPTKIVGPFPRFVIDGIYAYKTQRPRYELMLTKLNVMDSKYLFLASCDRRYVKQRRFVTEKNNAEDIFMNVVVYDQTKAPPALLYLPSNPIYDCGVDQKKSGLHFRPGFMNERQAAVYDFKLSAAYSTADVYLTNGSALHKEKLVAPPPDVGARRGVVECLN